MVRKAVIPAAGHATRQYPVSACVRKGLFPVIDRDGLPKPVLQLAVEEALAGGIEEIAIVVNPGDEEAYRAAFCRLLGERYQAFADKPWALEMSAHLQKLGERITFLHQTEPHGYGHAVWCARDWVGDEPFLVILGDHVFMSGTETPCAKQLLDAFRVLRKSVSGLQRIGPDALCRFGTVRAIPSELHDRTYRLQSIVEKPSLEYAREHLVINTLPRDTYLGWLGQHVVTPAIFECLDEQICMADRAEIGFTEAQAALCEREEYYGLEIDGTAHDTGQPGTYLCALLQIGLQGPYREQLLQTWNEERGTSLGAAASASMMSSSEARFESRPTNQDRSL